MTRVEDIEYAVELGADALGLIFYPKSLRYVTLELAKTLTQKTFPFVDVVAVLVNPEKEFVKQLLEELPIGMLQFHGDENQAFCQQFNRPFIKAIQAKDSNQIHKAMQSFHKAKALLLDTPSTSSRGGSGELFDWDIIPKNPSLPIILSGGLNESNIQRAQALVNPYAVDLCSSLEERPGIKDHNKMRLFMKTLWGK